MNAHEFGDLLLISAAVGECAVLFWLLGQKHYWRRIARLHENARCDAQSRERCLMNACEALRRALGKLQPEDSVQGSGSVQPADGDGAA